jgi:hypothetical protein
MSDLLSGFINGQMAGAYVKKIYKLMSTVLVFTLIWTAIELLEWYKYIENSPIVSRLPHPFYRYKIWPALGIVELALNVLVNVLAYQAWGDVKSYIHSSDENLLHKGLKNFYIAALVTTVWFSISILNIFYRTFFL